MCGWETGFYDQLLHVPLHLPYYSSTVPPVKWITIWHSCQSDSICLNLLENYLDLRFSTAIFCVSFNSFNLIETYVCIAAPHPLFHCNRSGYMLCTFMPKHLVGTYFQLNMVVGHLSFFCGNTYSIDCVLMFRQRHRALPVHFSTPDGPASLGQFTGYCQVFLVLSVLSLLRHSC